MAASKMTHNKRVKKEMINVMVIGKTSTGKSSLCNTLVSPKQAEEDEEEEEEGEIFPTSCDAGSGTSKVYADIATFGNHHFLLVDTPGLCDTRPTSELAKTEAKKVKKSGTDDFEKQNIVTENMEEGIKQCPGGADCFLFVVRPDVAFTREEAQTAKTLGRIFGDELFTKFCLLVFTHSGPHLKNLKKKKISTDKWCERQKGDLKELLTKCKNRYRFIDNEEPNCKQREEILNCIVQMKDSNAERYSHDLFKKHAAERKKMLEEANLPWITENIIERETVLMSKQRNLLRTTTMKDVVKLDEIKESAEDLLAELNEVTASSRELEEQKMKVQNFISSLDAHIKDTIKSLEEETFKKINKSSARVTTVAVLHTMLGTALAGLTISGIGLPLAAGLTSLYGVETGLGILAIKKSRDEVCTTKSEFEEGLEYRNEQFSKRRQETEKKNGNK